jgi:hypothetical protein
VALGTTHKVGQLLHPSTPVCSFHQPVLVHERERHPADRERGSGWGGESAAWPLATAGGPIVVPATHLSKQAEAWPSGPHTKGSTLVVRLTQKPGMRVAMFCPGPKPPAPAPASPAPLRKPATKKTVVFGSDKDLGIVLTSDDPLDQLWLEIDKDGDGKLGEEEVCQVLVMMKRATETGAPRTKEIAQTVMKELDTDGSGDIDIGEFQVRGEARCGDGCPALPGARTLRTRAVPSALLSVHNSRQA